MAFQDDVNVVRDYIDSVFQLLKEREPGIADSHAEAVAAHERIERALRLAWDDGYNWGYDGDTGAENPFKEASARLHRGAPCELCSGRGCKSCLGTGQSTISETTRG